MKTRILIFLLALGFLSAAPANVFAAGKDHKSLGDQWLFKNKPLRAVEEYKQALRSNPDSTAALFNLAIAYYALREIQNAILCLEKIAQLNPSDFEAQYNLGCLWLYKGDLEKAGKYFLRAEKTCSTASPLRPLIQQGRELTGDLKTVDRSTQDLFFMLTQYGLVPQPASA